MSNKSVRKSVLVVMAVALLALVLAPAGTALASDLERGGPGWGQRGVTPVPSPLDAAEVTALNEAIEEEYGALNTYNAVMEQYGSVLPFSRIARSEQQHVSALSGLFTKYGLSVPVNPGYDGPESWPNLAAACQTGVDAEIADAALYDELMLTVDNADLIRVFTNLKNASLNSHLPAFEACN